MDGMAVDSKWEMSFGGMDRGGWKLRRCSTYEYHNSYTTLARKNFVL